MGKLLFIVSLMILVSCGTPDAAAAKPPAATDFPPANTFDWLTGHWQRSDDKPGRQTFERWERTTAALYSGFGYTLEEKDTVWQEDMRLYQTGTEWTLEVSGEGEKIPFKLNVISPTGFTGANPEHDFPKEIRYELRGDSLYALVVGGEMEIPFTFGRKE
jgi:hypothetical protein